MQTLARGTLTLALILAAACDVVDADLSSGPLLRTDASSYTVTFRDELLQVSIPYSFDNRTDQDLYLEWCGDILHPFLERKIEGEWAVAWEPVDYNCVPALLPLPKGQTHTDTLNVYAHPFGDVRKPQFASEDLTGTYRLKWRDIWVNVNPQYTSRPFGDALPEDLRASNELHLDDPTAPKGDSAPVGHYRFDGSFADATGRGAAGVASGTGISFVANRSGQSNRALGLNGGELRIPESSTNGLAEGTISLWARGDNPTSRELCERQDLPASSPFYCQYNLFGKGSGEPRLRAQFGARLAGGAVDRLSYQVNGESPLVTLPVREIDTGTWHMYTFTWGRFGRRIYLDGALWFSGSGAVTSPSSGEFVVGASGSSAFPARERLRGAVDELRFYNRALSNAEVAALFQE